MKAPLQRIVRSLQLPLVAAVSLLFVTGCAGLFCRIPSDPKGACYEDRCYIEDSQFIFADQLYSRFGSLHLVERELREIRQWRECEVNEALYRLRKVHCLP